MNNDFLKLLTPETYKETKIVSKNGNTYRVVNDLILEIVSVFLDDKLIKRISTNKEFGDLVNLNLNEYLTKLIDDYEFLTEYNQKEFHHFGIKI